MNITERRMAIFDDLKSRGVVELTELAETYDVSTMTVRRDLQLFERQGLLTMNHGSAYLNRDAARLEPTFAAKSANMASEKQLIGRTAAGLVEDGDSIIVDCGTTTLQMLRYLGTKDITVITNSMPASSLVGASSHVRLIYAPGEYSETSAGLLDEMTVEFYSKLHVDKAFVATHALSSTEGATQPTFNDAVVKRAIIAAARDSYLLVDSTKYGQVSLAHAADLSVFSAIVTDGGYDEESRAELEAVAQRVIYAT